MEDSSSKMEVKSKVKHLDKSDIDGTIFRNTKIQVPENSEELPALLGITQADKRALRVSQINHPNILKIFLSAPTKDDMYQRIYAEVIKGKLKNYLMSHKNILLPQSDNLPSETLVKIVRCMIDVLGCIHRWDEYHGNICLDSFYYQVKLRKPEIKLANFITNDFKTLEEAQLEDWHKIGTLVIPDIISVLEKHGIMTTTPMLEDLATFFGTLKNVTDAEKAYKRAFFMDNETQINFMRLSLPFLVEKSSFLDKVSTNLNSIGVSFPWDLGYYECFVPVVENYNKSNYDRSNIHHFLKVLLAIYEHYDWVYTQVSHLLGLKLLHDFHEDKMKKYPKLLLHLRSIDLELYVKLPHDEFASLIFHEHAPAIQI